MWPFIPALTLTLGYRLIARHWAWLTAPRRWGRRVGDA